MILAIGKPSVVVPRNVIDVDRASSFRLLRHEPPTFNLDSNLMLLHPDVLFQELQVVGLRDRTTTKYMVVLHRLISIRDPRAAKSSEFCNNLLPEIVIDAYIMQFKSFQQ